MKLAYDLHIHSGLSPCGDKDMTPNNIVNMAFLKGLKIIAVTDHNSMLNLEAVVEVAKKREILVVPGIEVTTREEVHVLCYFSTVEDGMSFQDLIYDSLANITNKEILFGEQLLFDKEDNIIGKVEKMLLGSSKYSLEEIFNLVEKHNGVVVPAHVDNSSFSILSTLGFFPDNIDIRTIEVHDMKRLKKMVGVLNLEKYKIVNNSDAHYLFSISEADYHMDLGRATVSSVIDYLKAGCDIN
ncbi:MAG: PHP domain-containing protein [Tissierellales bacterium]